MIHLFYRAVYRGRKKNRPHIVDVDSSKIVKDPDLLKIIKSSIENNPHNNEICFFFDSVTQSYAYIVAYTLIGEGIKITIKDNPDAEKILRDWNSNINILGDTIDDLVIDAIIDNFIHARSYWRVDELTTGTDVQRVSPKTIRVERASIHGWRKFVQYQSGRIPWKSYNEFLRGNARTHRISHQPQNINIPDDPSVFLNISFFRHPPMASINHLVAYKRWILMFLRKYAERMWSPTRIGKVGNPKTNFMPNSPEEMQEGIDNLAEAMLGLTNFANIAIPGHFDIETHEPSTNGEIYLKYIEMLNEEIMFGLFGSMGIRRATETWKSNNIVDESVVHVLSGIRREFESVLKRFYTAKLVPDVDPNDIVFHWSPLRTSSINDLGNTIEKLVKIGAFKNTKEIRRAAALAFPFLSEQDLTDEEDKDLWDYLVLMNAPSQPETVTTDAINNNNT